MTTLENVTLIAGLAAITAVPILIMWRLGLTRNVRLMRCPATGAIALVNVESVSRSGSQPPETRVRSCELWPEHKQCDRGCLERYDQTTPGFHVNVEALRPFHRP